MKIWSAFGTEHSMNLVMIGRFKEVRNAEEAKRLIDRLTEFVLKEGRTSSSETGSEGDRFSTPIRSLLNDERLYNIAPAELESVSLRR